MFDEGISRGRGLFFVQGLWRSGTSWMGRMLNSLPEAYVCPHELHGFMRMFEVSQFGESLAENPFLRERYDAGRRAGFLAMLLHFHRQEKPGAVRIGERSPGADVAALKASFPESKMLIVLRDGRDACVSQAFLGMQTGLHAGVIDERSQVSPEYALPLAAMYARYIPEYFALKAAYPDDVLLVRYEDLRRDPVAEMSRVLTWFEADIDEAGVRELCGRHSFASETSAQDDGQRWMRRGSVGDWERHLSAECAASYERIAGRALEMAGYTLSRPLEEPRPPTQIDVLTESLTALADLHNDLKSAFPDVKWRVLEAARKSLWHFRHDWFVQPAPGRKWLRSGALREDLARWRRLRQFRPD